MAVFLYNRRMSIGLNMLVNCFDLADVCWLFRKYQIGINFYLTKGYKRHKVNVIDVIILLDRCCPATSCLPIKPRNCGATNGRGQTNSHTRFWHTILALSYCFAR